MELSRTYVPGFVGVLSTSGGLAGQVVGGTGALDCTLVADDGKFLRWPLNDYAPPFGSAAWTIAYDHAIPTGATITRVVCSYKYASTNTGPADLQGLAWREGDFNSAFLPLPTEAGEDPEPKGGMWQEGEAEFTDIAGVPFTVSGLLLGQYSFEWLVGPDHAAPGTWWLDQVAARVYYTLPTPTMGDVAFQAVRRNALVVGGNVGIPSGGVNALHPLTCWFQYTKMDPASEGFVDLALGQGAVVDSDKQTITDVGDGAGRSKWISGVISDLTPGTTYHIRMAGQLVDGSEVFGAWGEVTTPIFDARSSF